MWPMVDAPLVRTRLWFFGLDAGVRYGCISARMKTRLSLLLAGICALCLSAGCYSTVDGHKKMGTPFAKDRLESRYERPVDQIFAAAKEVLANMGRLVSENTIGKTLEARIDNNTVWVKVDEVEPNISRVIVQARRSGWGGNIDLASEVDKQIALHLQVQ